MSNWQRKLFLLARSQHEQKRGEDQKSACHFASEIFLGVFGGTYRMHLFEGDFQVRKQSNLVISLL